MNGLLALAGTTSLFGGPAMGTPSLQQLEDRIPGFGVLQSFFKTWLRLDLTSVLTIAALMGAASSGAQSIQSTGSKLYWWIVRFLTASISIAGNDRLNREVLNWLGANVLAKAGTRILTANSETIQSDAWHYRRVQQRNDLHHEKRVPVQYLPTFGTTWFVHGRNIFMVRRILTNSSHYNSAWSMRTPDEYAGAPEGDEPLVVMCLGRSVEPIKAFLHSCRDFADKQREAFVTVRGSKHHGYDESWDITILRPLRALETVHFDEKLKKELVDDINNYLDVNTRRFYNRRGIPYRRGYLLHGPPGTGKTSLALALASHFGLELYLVHMPSVHEDSSLGKLFTSLPPRCIVLLEDIDAVGIKRRSKKQANDDDEDSDDEKEEEDHRSSSRCTLSGLLNVLDGVASQEGRIVLMTSNFAEKLDKALVRPGRVDKMIYLGNTTHRSNELMFLRMYSVDGDDGPAPADKTAYVPEIELKWLALEFGKQIPDDTFTPAQIQGYLLNHRSSPVDATDNIQTWVKEEKELMEEAERKARMASEQRKKKKAEAKKEKAEKEKAEKEKSGKKGDEDFDSDSELERLKKTMKAEEQDREQDSKDKPSEDKKSSKQQDTSDSGDKVSSEDRQTFEDKKLRESEAKCNKAADNDKESPDSATEVASNASK